MTLVLALQELLHLCERLLDRVAQVQPEGGNRDAVSFRDDFAPGSLQATASFNIYEILLDSLLKKLIFKLFVSLFQLKFAQLGP